MGKKELSGRKNWQELGGSEAMQAEQNLYQVFREHFMGTKISCMKNPSI